MFEYLIINQVQPPAQQPAQPVAPQPAVPQQPVQPAAPQPVQPGQPVAPQAVPQQPVPGAVPIGAATGDVSMVKMLQWAGIGGAASGAIQSIFNLVIGFDLVNFGMTVGIAIVIGILVAIILGQFGKKIPIQATLMVKAAAIMFVVNLIPGFIFSPNFGFLTITLMIVGIGAGAFLYGWLLQNKLPNLM